MSVEYKIGNRFFDAVHDVSLEVDHSKSLALVGESGSGKSTIGLAVMGLLPRNGRVRKGHLMFDDQDLTRMSSEELRHLRPRKMAMIFQGSMNSLDPIRKTGDQMVELLRYHKGTKRDVAIKLSQESVEEVGLSSSVLDLYPHELSGGMRQRVAIVMALILSPRLLIADEPTTALDLVTQAEVMVLIRDIVKKKGMSLLFMTHDLRLASSLCDEVAVLYGGTTMEKGAVNDVFLRPLNPYTKALMSSVINLKQDHLHSIPGEPPTIQNIPRGCPFQDRCDSVMESCRNTLPDEVEIENRKVRCHIFGKNRV